MGPDGGWVVITKHIVGGQVHVCTCGILGIYKIHIYSAVIIEVQADMYVSGV